MRPARMSRSNLPAELSSFVGRRNELARLRALIAQNRLVTLFGPGGVGKTRLALRAAAELSSEYAEGAWIVELAHVTDPTLVPDILGAALGIREEDAEGPTLVRLVAHLRDREMLIVLDNCEHVDAAAAQLAAGLLRGCPRLRILATSRHRLVVEGECLLPVAPLTVPDSERNGGSVAGLMHYDAVRLFVDRAQASWEPFRMDAANQQAVSELVRRLDGVPLAIELASARVRSLSVQQILDRLSDRFGLLTTGSATAVPRQRSLRALIDWSHDLLDEQEQLLWSRSSVFGGSFDLEALRAVVCDERLPASVLDERVAGLVAKSVLVPRPTAEGAPARFSMLESLREYGESRLGGPERDGFAQRHLEHYLDLAGRAAREMWGPSEVAWFQRLRADHDNLGLALERCATDPDRAVDGMRIMARLLHYWVMVGRFCEGRRWLTRLLDYPGDPGLERTAGMVVAGRLAVLQGDLGNARPLLEEALVRATETQSRTWRAHALHGLAIATAFWGEPQQAVALLDEARALHESGEDPFGVPLALVQLATVHASLEDLDTSLGFAEECIRRCEAAEEVYCAAMARWTQAWVAWRQGRPERAAGEARRVLALKEPFGDRLGMAMSMELVAWVLAEQGRHGDSARLLGAVEAALGSVGGRLFRNLHGGHEACVDRLRVAMGQPALEEAWSAGALMAFEDAVAFASDAPGAGRPGARAGLTPREVEVVRLVAEGLSDREVSDRLVISRRTAEGHVARALGKLGLGSRGELVPWVAEHLPPN